MLVLHRRHVTTCRHKSRTYRKCLCPIWLDWRIGRKRVQKPIGTRDWQIAQIRARELEADGIGGEIVPLTIEQATEKYMAYATARGLRQPSLYKYRLLFKQMQAFAQQSGFVFLSQLDTGAVRAFRESWTNKNLSARKKLEHMKAFFRFCHDSGWIKENPAKIIKPPTVNDPPVLPFYDAEMKKILAACDTHRNPDRAIQLRAISLLMRHSGLSIGDACTLCRDKIDKNGLLELYTEKTGTKVRIPLKPEVLDALGKIPKNGDYYFWSGT